MKRMLAILGHPSSDSLRHPLGRAYDEAASQNAEVRIAELCQLERIGETRESRRFRVSETVSPQEETYSARGKT
jgi:hypothetical protein